MLLKFDESAGLYLSREDTGTGSLSQYRKFGLGDRFLAYSNTPPLLGDPGKPELER